MPFRMHNFLRVPKTTKTENVHFLTSTVSQTDSRQKARQTWNLSVKFAIFSVLENVWYSLQQYPSFYTHAGSKWHNKGEQVLALSLVCRGERERVAKLSYNKDKGKQEKERRDEKMQTNEKTGEDKTRDKDKRHREFIYPFCCSFPNLASRPLVPVSAVILAWCCFLCFAKLPGPSQSVFR